MGEVAKVIKGAVTFAAGVVASFVPGVGQFLGPMLMVYGANMMAEGLTGPSLAQRQEGATLNVASNIAPLRVIYGTAKVGLQLADLRQDPNEIDDLFVVGVLSLASENGSGITGVQEVYFDEERAIFDATATYLSVGDFGLTTGLLHPYDAELDATDPEHKAQVWYALHLGTDAETVDSVLSTRFASAWPSTSRGQGVAWLGLKLRYHKEVFSSGRPNVTCIVDGQKVYDPRDGTWKFSNNPALCTLDYLTSKRYGKGAIYKQRDGGTAPTEIDEQSFIDGANYADELVSKPGGGSQKRFTCDGWLSTGDSHNRNLQALLSACRGQLSYDGGTYRLLIRQPTTATTFELTPDNIIGDWRWGRDGSDVPNTMKATFVDASEDYQPNDVIWPDPGGNDFLPADGNLDSTVEIDLPFTQDYIRAQQLLIVALKEVREDVPVEVTCTAEALQLQVGDVVPLTHPTPGWTGKEFWVDYIALQPDDTVRLGLHEYDVAAYNLDPQSDKPTVPGSNLPDPFSVDPPTQFTATSSEATAIIFGNGTVQPRVLLTWAKSSDKWLAGYELQYKKSADSAWQPAGSADAGVSLKYISEVMPDVAYDFRIRAINTLGRTSLWQEVVSHTVSTDPGNHFPIIKTMTSESSSGGTGTLTVTVIDPAGGDMIVRFFSRTDRTSYSATPDATHDPVATGGSVSHTVGMQPKINSRIRCEAELKSNGNTADVEVVFDVDNIAELETLSVDMLDDGRVVVHTGGDSDAVSAVADLTGGITETLNIVGRVGSATSTGVAAPGTTVNVSAYCVNDEGVAGPAKTTQVTRPGSGTVGSGTGPIVELAWGQTGSETQEAFDLFADVHPTLGVGPLRYKWRHRFSPVATEQTYDHTDPPDGVDDWTTLLAGETGVWLPEEILTARRDDGFTGMLEVVVEDTGIGDPGAHPYTKAMLEVQSYQQATGQDAGGVIVTSTDPGEGATTEPDNTLWVVTG